MEFGVFSDIHGNLSALESLWTAFETAGLTGKDHVILNAGDNVGYGDAPEACVQFLQTHSNIVTVQGNYDRNVARYPEREAEYRKKWGRNRPDKLEALRRDSGRISDVSRAWLLSLPKERELTLSGVRVLITHYAPGVKEGLGPWTTNHRLQELAEQTEAQVVVCGHSHAEFVREAGGVLFVNPGTAGRDWSGRLHSAILDLHENVPPTARLLSMRG